MNNDIDSTAPILLAEGIAGREAGEVVALADSEGAHLRALRLEAGSAVRLTDAAGELWLARLTDTGRGATARLEHRLSAPPPLEVELWPPVANKQATLWLVEKATEFGLRRLCPVETRRSASVTDAGRSSGFWKKAERRALAAVKQSGSARLPDIRTPASLEERLGRLDPARIAVLLDSAGPPLSEVFQGWAPDEVAVMLVGPEGGLTDDERGACVGAGFHPASLGPTTLRFETAAVAALAVAAQRTLRAGSTVSM
ncbi:MAG: RsmE family RNA methyltransferase [Gemmatimonadota bacterium]